MAGACVEHREIGTDRFNLIDEPYPHVPVNRTSVGRDVHSVTRGMGFDRADFQPSQAPGIMTWVCLALRASQRPGMLPSRYDVVLMQVKIPKRE